VSELAKGQHGVVSRRQLLAAGVSGSAMRRMTASGWLDPIHAGVYLVAGGSLTREAAWMAAVLAGGESALLSHRSAGELWGLVEPIEGPCHVTVTHGRRTHAGIVLHRTRHPAARAVRYRIPVTAPSRTLLDLAAVLSDRRLSRALEAADRHQLLDITELTRLCEASSGRKGTGRLSSLLARYRSLPETRSELERRFLRLCREAGLPPPAINVPVAGVEVDFLWPGARVVVELDGYAFHRDRAAFERDRVRDAKLQLAGYRVLRVTYRRLVEEADAVIAEVSALLRLREASASLP
jgi:very-short-patch-repair endonuclease